MMEMASSDTRERLISAAADLIAASPGEDFSLRAVCDAVGVKMPTLYHFFGSKQGLIDAVVEHGFDLYLGEKAAMESSGDPIQDIRAGWDAHVAFGLTNPGFYTLMYGKVSPGHSPAGQSRANEILKGLTARAADQGRLAVSPDQAAAHVLVSNIGVTLRQIMLAQPDPELSHAVREGVVAAITGTATGQGDALNAAIEVAAAHPHILGATETQLLVEWLGKLSREVS
ncbi:TetR/AcrR family transcriptional regulator [Streptomyces sp. SBST2-5]|uniref:TetR/AcrR family transcriptional regulator n=1 Tax=Streptomyces composti TaxID=2720025 RepID=A0ABX1A8W4_9ACTN|nr:TetR/AcrR family transcriptional regulator [Streptomyces composti]NJP52925.1 TetR/AcrR family transcriptional regulator [Streptomyces composti]